MSSSPTSTSTPSKSTASTTFQLHYRKHKYTPDTIEPALLYDIQNYIPIYSRFFDINETNYNGIQLNQKYYLQNIISHPSQIMESGRDDRDDERNYQDDRDMSRSLNHLETIIADDNGNTSNVPIFVKYSPLLDPIRYLSGKYQVQENKTRTLPKYNSTPDDCEEKMLNTNNTSYVDGFFSYLTSRALHTHGVVHGVDYYGSYLCKQREFSTNVFDDIDYLVGCSFFNNYENDLFTIDYSQFGDDIEGDLSDVNMNKMMKIRNKMKSMIGPTGQDSYLQTGDDYHSMKNRINILDHISESESGICDDTVTIEPEHPLSLDVSVLDTEKIDRIQSDTNADAPEVVDLVVNDETDTISSVALHPKKQTRDHDEMSDSDSSQSNSSYTTMSNDDDHDDLNPENSIQVDDTSFAKEDEGKGDGDESGSGSGSGSETGDDDTGSGSGDDSGSYSDSASYDSDDEQIIVKIKDFPIQAILLEKCVSTLDRIMMTDELTKEEWSSILFQIIMTLIMYQKMFEFTHNDLHTNNVMFVETTEEFLYYFYEDQYYKVPTYGRIFKIIDFGRAIYKFRGELICSDSFHPKGDAATQYNFPPYYNPDKPTVEPNFSFDLCRFACALFDYFIYDLRKVEKLCKSDPIIKLVVKWTTDDKGRNVLYKSNGEERYPDFKLYKMISRSVHGHIPSNEIHNPLFDTYKITHKKYKKHAALAAKFLKDGRNTHIIMNVDALPSYSGGGSGCSETSHGEPELHSSQ
jgi:hypothetical protein